MTIKLLFIETEDASLINLFCILLKFETYHKMFNFDTHQCFTHAVNNNYYLEMRKRDLEKRGGGEREKATKIRERY